jgi:hypothetical protein
MSAIFGFETRTTNIETSNYFKVRTINFQNKDNIDLENTHFVKNYFVENHKDGQKISG